LKTKIRKIKKRILSLALALVMLVGMVTMMDLTAYAAPSEAETIPTSSTAKHAYSENLTVYYRHNNYLYQAVFFNIRALEKVGLRFSNPDTSSYLQLDGANSLYLAPKPGVTTYVYKSDFPTQTGSSVRFYLRKMADLYAKDSDKPVVIITCIAVNEPTWTWNGTTSATATFTSTDGNAMMTVEADIIKYTQYPTNCLEKGKVTYTATATANGQTYTDTKTADGEAGPHSLTYVTSASGDTITETCSHNCGYSETATLSIDTSASLKYTGSAIQPLKVDYSDGWQGGTLDIAYQNNTAVSTGENKASGSITKDDATATKEFAIEKGDMNITMFGYEGPYDGAEHCILIDAPEGATVTYSTSEDGSYTASNPTYAEKGTYTVWYKVEKENYNTISGSSQIVISQAANSWITEPSIEGWTYGENAKTPSYEAKFGTVKVEYRLASGTDNDYTITVPKEAGSYLVRFSAEGNKNYTSLSKVVDLEIAKVNLTVTAEDKSKTYGDSDPALTWQITKGALVGGDSLENISISRAEGENANNYAITVSQAEGANKNYNITFVDGTFTINPKEIDIKWTDTEFTYDGTEKLPTATVNNLVSGDSCTITVTGKQSDAGTYTATAESVDNNNYKLPIQNTTTFVIKNKSQDAPTTITVVDETIKGKGDGKLLNVTDAMEYYMAENATDVPNESTVYTQIGSGITSLEDMRAGTYYVRYEAKTNYDASEPQKMVIDEGKMLKIVVPQNTVGYSVTTDKTEIEWEGEYTFTVTIADGYTATEDFAIWIGEWNTGLEPNKLHHMMNAIADQVITVEGVADITPPTAEIQVKENKWNSLFNGLTFGIFFKETQEVTITANDVNTGSGLDKVYYYLSETEISAEEIKALADADWVEYTASFNINPDKEYIIYAKATDKAGNIVCINSNGLVLDATAPKITGIENNGTYYGNTEFGVTESYLDTVTLDGETITLTDGKYTITADDKEHTIIATDKATNSNATMKVKVIAIVSLDDAIEELTASNVKSSDKEAIKEILELVESLLDSGKDFTDAEDAKLAAIKSNAETLLDQIKKAEDAVDNETTGKVDNINSDNVNVSDKDNLEDAKADLEQALRDYPDNFTESEKEAIEADIQRLEDAIRSIEKVEDATSKITNLPIEVEPDDLETVDKIKDAKNAYDLLTDHEKSLINAEDKEKLESLLTQSVDYKIVEGNGSSIREDSDGNLRFKANGAYSKFTGVKVDNNLIDAQYYTAESGSTIIALKNGFLDKLSVGTHSLTVMYTDGEATGNFTITAKPSSPSNDEDSEGTSTEDNGGTGTVDSSTSTQGASSDNFTQKVPETGDETRIALYITTFLFAGIGFILLAILPRRKK